MGVGSRARRVRVRARPGLRTRRPCSCPGTPMSPWRPDRPRHAHRLPALMLAISGSDLLCLGLRGGGCGTYRAAARPHFGSRLVSVVARAADVHRLGDGDRGRRLPGVPRPTHRHRARPGRAQPLGARLRRARAGPSVALRRVGRMLFDGSGGGDPVTRGAGGQLAAVVWQVKANDGMVAVPHRFRRRLSWVHPRSVRAAGPGQADRVARALAAARRRRLGDRLNTLVRALHLVAGAAILGCAAAIAVALSAPGWWRPLASSAQPLVWVPSWSSTTDRLDCWSWKVPSVPWPA